MFAKLLFFIVCFFSLCEALDPESQIVVLENFVSSDKAKRLIHFYDQEKTDLNDYTDNQVTFSSRTDLHIRQVILSISRDILRVMKKKYGLDINRYHIDHCALYARTAGNHCPYHADNVYFDCPVHGKDQNRLRATCKGTCPGAKFFPNHTGWREYTALLYLNDEFEGGEILFEDGPCNRIYKKIIPIKANMVVIAPNNQNFYHEVFRIRKGKRYSLHIWYTSDPHHRASYLN
jgi:hypothetical protein